MSIPFQKVTRLDESFEIGGVMKFLEKSWDYSLTVTASDNFGNCYTEDFTIHASYFQNGLLNSTTGWTVTKGTVGATDYTSPLRNPVYGLTTTNSTRTCLEQSFPVIPNKDYTLVFWCRNNSTTEQPARIEISELNQEIDCLPSGDSYRCYALTFNSGTYTTLTIILNSGNTGGTTSENTFFTGLRLFPTHSYNLGFEELTNDFPVFWDIARRYSLATTITVENDPTNIRGGDHSLKINNSRNNAAFAVNRIIVVKPNTRYRLTGYVKTAGVSQGRGAYIYISYNNTYWNSNGIFATNDLPVYFFKISSGCLRLTFEAASFVSLKLMSQFSRSFFVVSRIIASCGKGSVLHYFILSS